jgi:hypothetical protein
MSPRRQANRKERPNVRQQASKFSQPANWIAADAQITRTEIWIPINKLDEWWPGAESNRRADASFSSHDVIHESAVTPKVTQRFFSFKKPSDPALGEVRSRARFRPDTSIFNSTEPVANRLAHRPLEPLPLRQGKTADHSTCMPTKFATLLPLGLQELVTIFTAVPLSRAARAIASTSLPSLELHVKYAS